jgi:hypothetical protein
MGRMARILAAGVVALAAAGFARAQDAGPPLAACAEAVGAYLTDNPGTEPSRSLITLSADGLVQFADSGEGGGAGFAPFTGGHGAWRCVAGDAGALRLSATILDFTLPTAAWPHQQIGRLDIEASVDPAKGTMTGTMKLMTAPLDGDPLEAAELVEDASGEFVAVRITAP